MHLDDVPSGQRDFAVPTWENNFPVVKDQAAIKVFGYNFRIIRVRRGLESGSTTFSAVTSPFA